MLIAQITDTHCTRPGMRPRGAYDPEAALTRVVERLGTMTPRPDAVIATGDLTESGCSDEYEAFLRCVAQLGLPMLAVPGNHDRRASFAAALADTPVQIGCGPFLNVLDDTHPLRLIGLDSLGPEGAVSGQICSERLDWLATHLSEAPDRPTLVFLHHPPFETGMPADDAPCDGGASLGALIARHPSVIGVISGHLHRPILRSWRGLPAMACPSVGWAFRLDFRPEGRLEPTPRDPGYALHAWDADAGFVSHVDYVVG